MFLKRKFSNKCFYLVAAGCKNHLNKMLLLQCKQGGYLQP